MTHGLTSPAAMKHKNDTNMFLLFVPPVQCVHDVDGLLPLLEACCPCREKHDNRYTRTFRLRMGERNGDDDDGQGEDDDDDGGGVEDDDSVSNDARANR